MEEIWKDIPGYEGLYQASNLGRIRSLDRIRPDKNYKQKGRIMLFHKNHAGYYQLRLSKNGKAKTLRVNRLIALTFIPNRENKDSVNHINGIRTDNRVENLEWNTMKEQIWHQHKVLNTPYSDMKKCRMNKERKVIRSDGKIYNSIKEAKEDLGHKNAPIVEVCQGKRKTAYGYSFKYYEEE